MTFTGNTLADMNLLQESPGCYGFSWRFTGLEPTQVKVHRAVMDLIKVHRAVMDLTVESPGCSGFTPKLKYE
jgi:Fe-S cluster assembly iron-binding protein IscA